MEGIIKTAKSAIFRVLGITEIVNNWDEIPALLLILTIVGTTLTIVWMIKMFPRLSFSAGKTIGGLAMGIVVLLIGVAVYLWIAGIVLGIGTGAATGAISRISVDLGQFARKAVAAVIGFLLLVGIAWYVLTNLGSVISQAFGAVKETAMKWEDTDGGGFAAVEGGKRIKWVYLIFGVFIPAFALNHPEFMVKVYYIPQAASALFGIVALVLKTRRGRAKLENIRARRGHGPRQPDGAWLCINFDLVPEMRDGVPTGRMIKKYCDGPQGEDRHGNSFNGFNPKSARKCMSPFCDADPPYWQFCTTDGCEIAKSGQPFPRKPFEPVVCEGCNTTYLPRPESTGFHSADQDQYHTGMAGVPGASVPQPTAGQPATEAPVVLQLPESGTYVDATEIASYDAWLNPHA